jgi:hypothetical protein
LSRNFFAAPFYSTFLSLSCAKKSRERASGVKEGSLSSCLLVQLAATKKFQFQADEKTNDELRSQQYRKYCEERTKNGLLLHE